MRLTSHGEEDITGLKGFGVLALSVPLIGSVAMYLAATDLFGLPERAWAIISVGFAGAWYGFLRHGMQRAATASQVSDAEPRRRWWLRSIGGLALLAVGAWLLVFGDPTRAVTCLAAGVTLILVSQWWRR